MKRTWKRRLSGILALIAAGAVLPLAGCKSSTSADQSCREYCEGRGYTATYDTQNPTNCINWVASTQKRRGGWFFDVECCCYMR